ncbi:MAG: hypothetical protein COT28_16245 [Methylobacterium sp. CG08_land_8_20_14_0_20_71_15]|nr:MAG: hypothetical protein COT28_16245 [Methylobacterium sp. CG08_land_8_20_14_0_20_71_15]
MRMILGLLLGLLSATGVAAGERPRPAAAETLLPCPTQGPGFVRAPGSRTCFRLSGRAAGNLDLRPGRGGLETAPGVSGRFAIDTRADTDLGPVRTYVRIGQGRR